MPTGKTCPFAPTAVGSFISSSPTQVWEQSLIPGWVGKKVNPQPAVPPGKGACFWIGWRGAKYSILHRIWPELYNILMTVPLSFHHCITWRLVCSCMGGFMWSFEPQDYGWTQICIPGPALGNMSSFKDGPLGVQFQANVLKTIWYYRNIVGPMEFMTNYHAEQSKRLKQMCSWAE